MVYHLGDGCWWDADASWWHDDWGKQSRIASDADILGWARRTRMVLAAAHWDHDTSNNADVNLAAFCQRCHMIYDPPEHQRRRWRTLFRRKALGDLFGGPYACRLALVAWPSALLIEIQIVDQGAYRIAIDRLPLGNWWHQCVWQSWKCPGSCRQSNRWTVCQQGAAVGHQRRGLAGV